MNSVDLILRLHEHRVWVNAHLLESARSLDDAALRRSFAIGQGSVWKSLLHMYGAEYAWIECLLGKEQLIVPGDVAGKLPGNQEGEGAIGSLDDLDSKWRELDDRWIGYLSQLKADDLGEAIPKVSSAGKRALLRRSDILMHVCTHAHWTTAQVVNMLRQLGCEPLPEVMLIALAREQAASG